MNYRVTTEYLPPFKIIPYVEELGNYKLKLQLVLKATFADNYVAGQMAIRFAVPKESVSASFEFAKVAYCKE